MKHEWKMSHDDAGGSECFPKVTHIKSCTCPASAAFPKVHIVAEVIQESEENPEQSDRSQDFYSFCSLSCWKLRVLKWTQAQTYTRSSAETEQSMQTVTVEVAITDVRTYLWWSYGWLTDFSVERLKAYFIHQWKVLLFPSKFSVQSLMTLAVKKNKKKNCANTWIKWCQTKVNESFVWL